MQKQKNQQNYLSLKKKKAGRMDRIFRYSQTFFNVINTNILNIKNENKNIINIKVRPNNIFFTLTNSTKTLYINSAGKEKIKVSKNLLSFSHKAMLKNCLKDINNKIKKTPLVIKICGPKTIKESIIKIMCDRLSKNQLLLNNFGLHCFNGCRQPKAKRKKSTGVKVYKM